LLSVDEFVTENGSESLQQVGKWAFLIEGNIAEGVFRSDDTMV
jgi:hypothetical protein